ncbi:hypothetical protein J4476_03410 [Candidatus Woesearchaeota archaeon]|nr:MAG: hypothetical protein QT09_C0006G0007 [archaeon GW2011_AR18]MBS3161716.1 hypothetical protein [Candidatus Woesearchaeota archaeon]HIH25727.1 hypothetical protein [Nanoarchaeota archaeon]
MTAETNILQELKVIKAELKIIREYMVDVDSIMTEEDYKALEESREEKRKGKLITSEQLKKELGI